MRAALLALSACAMAGEAPRPLAPVHHDPEAYSETWTVVADLDDGGFVRFELAVSNIGPGSDHGGCRLSVLAPGQAPWTEELALGRDGWTWSAGPPETLTVGSCSLTAGPQVRVTAAFPAGQLDLRLDTALAPVAPPGHRLDTPGGTFFDERILAPWATASLQVQRPGQAARRAVGMATVDHFRVTALPDEIARQWIRFRGLSRAGSVLLEGRVAPDGESVAGWVWVQGSSTPVALDALRIDALPRSADGTPAWRATGRAGALAFRLRSTSLVRRYAPVENHGLLTLMLKGLIGNPVTFDHRAVLEGLGPEPLPGLLEVLVDEG